MKPLSMIKSGGTKQRYAVTYKQFWCLTHTDDTFIVQNITCKSYGMWIDYISGTNKCNRTKQAVKYI